MNSQHSTGNIQQPTVTTLPLTGCCLLLTVRRSLRQRIAWFAVFVALAFAVARTVEAHGGGVTQLSAAPVGPYRVTVWTAPTVIRADTPLHVTVAIADDGEQPVLDAAVKVELFAAGVTTPIVAATATTAQSTNKLFYEADFSPPQAGPHRVQVIVAGAEGAGAVDFGVDIQPPANTNWLGLGLAALAVTVAAALFKSNQARMPSRPARKKDRETPNVFMVD